MNQQKSCQDCNQRRNCQDAYRQLGSNKSPSIISKVVVAFLLPIVVFIAALAVFEGILAGTENTILQKMQSANPINTKEMQTAFSFLLALSATFVCILITKAVNKQFSKKQNE